MFAAAASIVPPKVTASSPSPAEIDAFTSTSLATLTASLPSPVEIEPALSVPVSSSLMTLPSMVTVSLPAPVDTSALRSAVYVAATVSDDVMTSAPEPDVTEPVLSSTRFVMLAVSLPVCDAPLTIEPVLLPTSPRVTLPAPDTLMVETSVSSTMPVIVRSAPASIEIVCLVVSTLSLRLSRETTEDALPFVTIVSVSICSVGVVAVEPTAKSVITALSSVTLTAWVSFNAASR